MAVVVSYLQETRAAVATLHMHISCQNAPKISLVIGVLLLLLLRLLVGHTTSAKEFVDGIRWNDFKVVDGVKQRTLKANKFRVIANDSNSWRLTNNTGNACRGFVRTVRHSV